MDKIIMIVPVNATWEDVKQAMDEAKDVLYKAKNNPTEATTKVTVSDYSNSITALIADIERRIGDLSDKKVGREKAMKNFSIGVFMGRITPNERIRIAEATDIETQMALKMLGFAWLPSYAKALGDVFEQNF